MMSPSLKGEGLVPGGEGAEERREQILQAALACFGRQGYHLTTMDDIVAESGLSKGTLYWYFKSKKELFVSLFQTMMERFGHEWEAIVVDESLTAREKLGASLSLYRAELDDLVPLFGTVMEAWALTRYDEEVGIITRELYEPYLALMERLIQQGVDSGEFHVDDVRSAAVVVSSLLDGVALGMGTTLTWIEDWSTILDTATTIVLRGLGVDIE